MINGAARYGVPELMTPLAADGETVQVRGQTRKLFLKQDTADPDVAALSLRKATDRNRSA